MPPKGEQTDKTGENASPEKVLEKKGNASRPLEHRGLKLGTPQLVTAVKTSYELKSESINVSRSLVDDIQNPFSPPEIEPHMVRFLAIVLSRINLTA